MKISLIAVLLLTLLNPAATLQSSPIEPMQTVTPTAARCQHPPEAVYLQFESGFIPLTLFADGESLIHYYDEQGMLGTLWWKYSLFWNKGITNQFQAFADELADSAFTYYALPKKEKGQTLSFQQIQEQLLVPPDEKLGPPFSPLVGIAANYGASDFLCDVAHTQYTAMEQKQVPAVYTKYVHHKLNLEGLTNTPVVIRDIWAFDFDDDGKDEAFILATNLPTDELGDLQRTTTRPAAKDELGYYTYVLFYSETFLPMDMVSYTERIWQSIFSPTYYGYAYWEPFSYQFDGQNNIKAFSMWNNTQHETQLRPTALPVICDLDQDGREDFILLGNYDDDTPICKVYLQKDDSQFQRLSYFRFFL